MRAAEMALTSEHCAQDILIEEERGKT